MLVFVIVSSVTKRVKMAYAIESWNDGFFLYPNSMVVHENVHMWRNNFSNNYQDVYLELVGIQNITVLKRYIVYANNTYFINITDSQVIVSNYTYYNLRQDETLIFNVLAKAKANMYGSCSVVITLRVYNVLIGDIDRNDWINILDGILLGKSWGMNSGQSGWDVKKDLNKDNVINVLDGILLGNHFGERF